MFSKTLFKHLTYQVFAPGALLRSKYNAFRELLKQDDRALTLIADLEDIYYGRARVDRAQAEWLLDELQTAVELLVAQLMFMSPARYVDLPEYIKKVSFYARLALDTKEPDPRPPFVISLREAAQMQPQAGGKAANLSRLMEVAGANVPPGFVITAGAFHYFLEAADLRPSIDAILRQLDLAEPAALEAHSRALCALIQEAALPREVAEPMLDAAFELAQDRAWPWRTLAVRSSAVAEDGIQGSFAGQYSSLLNVDPGNIFMAYKQVLMSKYSPRALTYRIHMGLSDVETPMAVLLLPMAPARAAGVVYTREPGSSCQHGGELSLYAKPGLGEGVVSGEVSPEIHCFTREPTPSHLGRETMDKGAADPVLTLAEASEIASLAMQVEETMGAPQDIEWALSESGAVHLLQSRPVTTNQTRARNIVEEDVRTQPAAAGRQQLAAAPSPPLAFGRGASFGVASGVVYHLPEGRNTSGIPPGAVVITDMLAPCLVEGISRMRAVVAMAGSRASHFASVAREFELPVVTGVENAFDLFAEGDTLTVDADTGAVYAGDVTSLLVAGDVGAPERSRLSAQLEKCMPHISKLSLTNPDADSFASEHIKSFHDAIRFCHEMGVQEMFSLVGKGARGLSLAKKLRTKLPLNVYVLDLDDGIFESAKKNDDISPDDIKSVPLWSLWFGMTSDESCWKNSPPATDLEALDRISHGIFSHDSKLLASYAIISNDYLHFMVRFGYHFSLVDTLCGENERENYISFRFKGGGGDYGQRLLRLYFLERVLSGRGFKVETKGDMLDARHPRAAEKVLQRRLATLGRLLATTRMMDTWLVDEAHVRNLASEFLEETSP